MSRSPEKKIGRAEEGTGGCRTPRESAAEQGRMNRGLSASVSHSGWAEGTRRPVGLKKKGREFSAVMDWSS